MDSKRFSGHHTKNLFSGRPTKAGIYFTDRAEGYPFVRRYPYRMLRRATWLKAASCLPPDTPPFLPSFLLSFSHLPFHRVLRIEYLMRHARKYSPPPQRNWLAFLRKWGKRERKIPLSPGIFIQFHRWWIQQPPLVLVCCSFLVDDRRDNETKLRT